MFNYIGNVLFLSWVVSTWGCLILYILHIFKIMHNILELYFLLFVFQMMEEYVQSFPYFKV